MDNTQIRLDLRAAALKNIAARGGNAVERLNFQSETYIHSLPVPEHRFWVSGAKASEVAVTPYSVQSARWMLQ
jgi:hypothetical protein